MTWKKINCQSSGRFNNNIHMMNNICCSKTVYLADILWFVVITCTDNIPVPFFRYLLFDLKPDTIGIIISGFTNLPLKTHPLHFQDKIGCQKTFFLSLYFTEKQYNTLTQYLQHFTCIAHKWSWSHIFNHNLNFKVSLFNFIYDHSSSFVFQKE